MAHWNDIESIVGIYKYRNINVWINLTCGALTKIYLNSPLLCSKSVSHCFFFPSTVVWCYMYKWCFFFISSSCFLSLTPLTNDIQFGRWLYVHLKIPQLCWAVMWPSNAASRVIRHHTSSGVDRTEPKYRSIVYGQRPMIKLEPVWDWSAWGPRTQDVTFARLRIQWDLARHQLSSPS